MENKMSNLRRRSKLRRFYPETSTDDLLADLSECESSTSESEVNNLRLRFRQNLPIPQPPKFTEAQICNHFGLKKNEGLVASTPLHRFRTRISDPSLSPIEKNLIDTIHACHLIKGKVAANEEKEERLKETNAVNDKDEEIIKIKKKKRYLESKNVKKEESDSEDEVEKLSSISMVKCHIKYKDNDCNKDGEDLKERPDVLPNTIQKNARSPEKGSKILPCDQIPKDINLRRLMFKVNSGKVDNFNFVQTSMKQKRRKCMIPKRYTLSNNSSSKENLKVKNNNKNEQSFVDFKDRIKQFAVKKNDRIFYFYKHRIKKPRGTINVVNDESSPHHLLERKEKLEWYLQSDRNFHPEIAKQDSQKTQQSDTEKDEILEAIERELKNMNSCENDECLVARESFTSTNNKCRATKNEKTIGKHSKYADELQELIDLLDYPPEQNITEHRKRQSECTNKHISQACEMKVNKAKQILSNLQNEIKPSKDACNEDKNRENRLKNSNTTVGEAEKEIISSDSTLLEEKINHHTKNKEEEIKDNNAKASKPVKQFKEKKSEVSSEDNVRNLKKSMIKSIEKIQERQYKNIGDQVDIGITSKEKIPCERNNTPFDIQNVANSIPENEQKRDQQVRKETRILLQKDAEVEQKIKELIDNEQKETRKVKKRSISKIIHTEIEYREQIESTANKEEFNKQSSTYNQKVETKMQYPCKRPVYEEESADSENVPKDLLETLNLQKVQSFKTGKKNHDQNTEQGRSFNKKQTKDEMDIESNETTNNDNQPLQKATVRNGSLCQRTRSLDRNEKESENDEMKVDNQTPEQRNDECLKKFEKHALHENELYSDEANDINKNNVSTNEKHLKKVENSNKKQILSENGSETEADDVNHAHRKSPLRNKRYFKKVKDTNKKCTLHENELEGVDANNDNQIPQKRNLRNEESLKKDRNFNKKHTVCECELEDHSASDDHLPQKNEKPLKSDKTLSESDPENNDVSDDNQLLQKKTLRNEKYLKNVEKTNKQQSLSESESEDVRADDNQIPQKGIFKNEKHLKTVRNSNKKQIPCKSDSDTDETNRYNHTPRKSTLRNEQHLRRSGNRNKRHTICESESEDDRANNDNYNLRKNTLRNEQHLKKPGSPNKRRTMSESESEDGRANNDNYNLRKSILKNEQHLKKSGSSNKRGSIYESELEDDRANNDNYNLQKSTLRNEHLKRSGSFNKRRMACESESEDDRANNDNYNLRKSTLRNEHYLKKFGSPNKRHTTCESESEGNRANDNYNLRKSILKNEQHLKKSGSYNKRVSICESDSEDDRASNDNYNLQKSTLRNEQNLKKSGSSNKRSTACESESEDDRANNDNYNLRKSTLRNEQHLKKSGSPNKRRTTCESESEDDRSNSDNYNLRKSILKNGQQLKKSGSSNKRGSICESDSEGDRASNNNYKLRKSTLRNEQNLKESGSSNKRGMACESESEDDRANNDNYNLRKSTLRNEQHLKKSGSPNKRFRTCESESKDDRSNSDNYNLRKSILKNGQQLKKSGSSNKRGLICESDSEGDRANNDNYNLQKSSLRNEQHLKRSGSSNKRHTTCESESEDDRANNDNFNLQKSILKNEQHLKKSGSSNKRGSICESESEDDKANNENYNLEKSTLRKEQHLKKSGSSNKSRTACESESEDDRANNYNYNPQKSTLRNEQHLKIVESLCESVYDEANYNNYISPKNTLGKEKHLKKVKNSDKKGYLHTIEFENNRVKDNNQTPRKSTSRSEQHLKKVGSSNKEHTLYEGELEDDGVNDDNQIHQKNNLRNERHPRKDVNSNQRHTICESESDSADEAKDNNQTLQKSTLRNSQHLKKFGNSNKKLSEGELEGHRTNDDNQNPQKSTLRNKKLFEKVRNSNKHSTVDKTKSESNDPNNDYQILQTQSGRKQTRYNAEVKNDEVTDQDQISQKGTSKRKKQLEKVKYSNKNDKSENENRPKTRGQKKKHKDTQSEDNVINEIDQRLYSPDKKNEDYVETDSGLPSNTKKRRTNTQSKRASSPAGSINKSDRVLRNKGLLLKDQYNMSNQVSSVVGSPRASTSVNSESSMLRRSTRTRRAPKRVYVATVFVSEREYKLYTNIVKPRTDDQSASIALSFLEKTNRQSADRSEGCFKVPKSIPQKTKKSSSSRAEKKQASNPELPVELTPDSGYSTSCLASNKKKSFSKRNAAESQTLHSKEDANFEDMERQRCSSLPPINEECEPMNTSMTDMATYNQEPDVNPRSWSVKRKSDDSDEVNRKKNTLLRNTSTGSEGETKKDERLNSAKDTKKDGLTVASEKETYSATLLKEKNCNLIEVDNSNKKTKETGQIKTSKRRLFFPRDKKSVCSTTSRAKSPSSKQNLENSNHRKVEENQLTEMTDEDENQQMHLDVLQKNSESSDGRVLKRNGELSDDELLVRRTKSPLSKKKLGKSGHKKVEKNQLTEMTDKDESQQMPLDVLQKNSEMKRNDESLVKRMKSPSDKNKSKSSCRTAKENRLTEATDVNEDQQMSFGVLQNNLEISETSVPFLSRRNGELLDDESLIRLTSRLSNDAANKVRYVVNNIVQKTSWHYNHPQMIPMPHQKGVRIGYTVYKKDLSSCTLSKGFMEVDPNCAKSLCYFKRSYAYFVIYNGNALVLLAGIRKRLEKGNTFFVPLGTDYAIQNTSTTEVLLLEFTNIRVERL